MRTFCKPVVYVSRCLGFEPCRFNGGIISFDFIKALAPFVELKTMCPEVELGLGVPRNPIRAVQVGSTVRLMQPSTGRDLTNEMEAYTLDFKDGVRAADGFILKARSPSCGLNNVKVYPGTDKKIPLKKAHGFFGGEISRTYIAQAVHDEEQLASPPVREHFLTKIFFLAEFRKVRGTKSIDELRAFHERNKMLLLLYNQKALCRMGKLLAKPGRKTAEEVFRLYAVELAGALDRVPRSDFSATVVKAAFGPFASRVLDREKAMFINSLVRFQEKQVPLSVPLGLVKTWMVRFEEPGLDQTLFEPYPKELVQITDSGMPR